MKEIIGVCDSGLGGLQVLSALMDAYPKADFMFIGDQANAPYGDKSKEELFACGSAMLTCFRQAGIKKVLIACNTLCANVLDQLEKAFPELELIGVLKPTAEQLKGKHVRSVLVMGTEKTIAAHAYEKALHAMDETLTVYEIACPSLVPLIENGNDTQALKEAAIRYVEPYIGKVDAVILGCTHFPLIIPYIQPILHAKIYDSNHAMTAVLHPQEGSGKVTIFTTRDAELMKRQMKQFIGKDLNAEKITF